MSPRSPLHGGISAIFSVRRRSGLAALISSQTSLISPPMSSVAVDSCSPAQAGEGQEIFDELAHHPGVVPDDVELVEGVLVEFVGVLPEDHPAVPVDGPERGAKVVGDRVAEALQLLVGRFELRRPLVQGFDRPHPLDQVGRLAGQEVQEPQVGLLGVAGGLIVGGEHPHDLAGAADQGGGLKGPDARLQQNVERRIIPQQGTFGHIIDDHAPAVGHGPAADDMDLLADAAEVIQERLIEAVVRRDPQSARLVDELDAPHVGAGDLDGCLDDRRPGARKGRPCLPGAC